MDGGPAIVATGSLEEPGLLGSALGFELRSSTLHAGRDSILGRSGGRRWLHPATGPTRE